MIKSYWFLPLSVILVVGCARQVEMSPQSKLDTAELHYRQGLRALDEDDVWAAQASFERARSLDENHPGVAVGSALVASAQGEFFKARKMLEGALHQDRSFVDAHVALAQVTAKEGMTQGRSPEQWLEPMRRSMTRAAQLAQADGSVPFRHGEIEFDAGEYDPARRALQRSISLAQAPWDERAKQLLTRMQTIERSTPGSPLGARIAAAQSVSRAELAVLLIEELHVEQHLAARRRLEAAAPPPAVEIDATALGIEMTWAQPFIERLLPLGIIGLEPLPDGSFAPEEPVTRAQLAMVVDDLLQRISGSDHSLNRYTGEASRFSDMPSDHYAYAAIANVVARGVMAPDAIAMTFRPSAPVQGAEALEVIRQLESALSSGY